MLILPTARGRLLFNLSQDWVQSVETDPTHREHPGTHDRRILPVPVRPLLCRDVLLHRNRERLCERHLLPRTPLVLPERHVAGFGRRPPIVIHYQVSLCQKLAVLDHVVSM